MRKAFILVLSIFLFYVPNAMGQAFKVDNLKNATDTFVNKLMIPNAFTPNHDGVNDVFKIQNFTNQKLIEFRIFNRWGTILFQTEDPKRGWDGTCRGKNQAMGVYGYIIRIAYADNVVETYKGTVTLLR